MFKISNVKSCFFLAPVSLSIFIGIYITKPVMYFIHSSCVIYVFASIIEACNACIISLFLLLLISSKIFSQISLSDITPRARNTINNGIGCFTRGISTQIELPNPLFFELTIMLIAFGEIHLKSGTDFTSAFQVYFVSFLEILKQYTRFSAARSCPNTVFSDPLIIK